MDAADRRISVAVAYARAYGSPLEREHIARFNCHFLQRTIHSTQIAISQCAPYGQTAPRDDRGAVGCGLDDRSEFDGNAGVKRLLGAASCVRTRADRAEIMIKAELVPPVAIGHPYIEMMGIVRAPDHLANVER